MFSEVTRWLLPLLFLANLVGIVLTLEAAARMRRNRFVQGGLTGEGYSPRSPFYEEKIPLLIATRWFWFSIVTFAMAKAAWASISGASLPLQTTGWMSAWWASSIVAFIVYLRGWHYVRRAFESWRSFDQNDSWREAQAIRLRLSRVFWFHVTIWIAFTGLLEVVRRM